jgi:hypothetical protein
VKASIFSNISQAETFPLQNLLVNGVSNNCYGVALGVSNRLWSCGRVYVATYPQPPSITSHFFIFFSFVTLLKERAEYTTVVYDVQ